MLKWNEKHFYVENFELSEKTSIEFVYFLCKQGKQNAGDLDEKARSQIKAYKKIQIFVGK